MAPESPTPMDLAARVAQLEAQVAWLLQQAQGRPASTDAAPAARPQAAPVPPRPVMRPAAPRREISPVVWIAGIGASIFLLGGIFFFRWAVQQGWVGAELRLLLGLLVGGGITAFAAKLILGDGRRLGVALLLAGLGTLQFSFRAGAFNYRFFPPALGLAGVALATFLAGVLAARARSGGALTVALASGLVAPLAFSQGGHHEVALALYLAALLGAALAVPLLAKAGGRWHGARWTALGGVWLLLLPACAEVMKADAGLLGLLLLAHLALAGLWIWLPGSEEKPGTPTPMWLLTTILATTYGWLLWKRLAWTPEVFALPVLGMATLNLALVLPLRKRLEGRQADLGLLALAAGHLALAVPVALAWRWVGPLWGVFALGLAWAAHRAEDTPFREEAGGLRWLAAGMALTATLRWAFHGLDTTFGTSLSMTPFFNTAFAEGLLASLAWFLLTRRGGPIGVTAFLALELTANLTLALEGARLVHWFQDQGALGMSRHYGPSRAASITMTLLWALSGAWQWMRGLRLEGEARRALLGAGYLWMGVASFKLIAADMAGADTPLRALAFLGVGAIGMVAAILAHRRPEAP